MPRIPTAKIGGDVVPALGQGTWRMGEEEEAKRREVASLRTGLELGMTVIDTAEMYADGGAERVVGEAIRGRRDDAFIVTKFLPQHASKKDMIAACRRSLRRLGTDRIDLYLYHWRGEVPLRETVDGLRELLRTEMIRHAGVSNFDVDDMEELSKLQDGVPIVADQVLYNLVRRGIEWDLLGWCRQRHRAVMAYSPIEEGLLSHRRHPALAEVAERHDATAIQVALAWLIRQRGVIAIPKTSSAAHRKEIAGAAHVRLTQRDLETLDSSFPAPNGPRPLDTR